jgi:uncharacterized protein (TIGR00255 family)
MIYSMTGYGSASHSTTLGEFSAEVKSLNNRFLDLTIKLPRELAFAEPEARELLKNRLNRGKIDLYVRWSPAPGTSPLYEINEQMLREYARQAHSALGSISGESTNGTAIQFELGALLALPGVVNPARVATTDSGLAEAVRAVAKEALDVLENTRRAEGSALADAIRRHLDDILQMKTEVEQRKSELVEEFRQKLSERIEALLKNSSGTIEPGRLEAEVAILADKADITEELVRLDTHLVAMRKLLDENGTRPVGKSMDFLVQEIVRETNTIGNKARSAAVASTVVRMKSEAEKIREQVQNIE